MPKVLAVRELRTHAMGLPHLRYLVAETVEGLAMGRHGVVPGRIPRPERLALHKMLVSQLRAATSDKRMNASRSRTAASVAPSDNRSTRRM